MCALLSAMNIASRTGNTWSCLSGNARQVCLGSSSSWVGVTCKNGLVTQIKLNDLGIKGSLPSELGLLSSLSVLDFSGNSVSGTIPSQLGQLAQLTNLNLEGNSITGPLPAELAQMPLVMVDISSNVLTGEIPFPIGNMPHLASLKLRDNNLQGTIPQSFSSLATLSTLDLGSNALSGNLDPLANLSPQNALTTINLDNNAFSGSIPRILADFWPSQD